MESPDTYYTIADESQASIREKASKFMAFAFPVESDQEVKNHLDSLRKSFHSANHHCYAYRIGHPEAPVFRYNDDGEPSGSAGKPIYGQLLSRQLSDTLVVVIRYFGGTKLGIPGLIQAYKTAAAESLNQNRIILKTLCDRFTISFPVRQMNKVMRIMKLEEAEILSQDFDEQYMIHFSVRKSRSDLIRTKLMSCTNISIFE
ncbi:MAG: YigZ family protein [Bacteroidetes bacterium]|nr:MAG: YigZ family protein [Bacteroidota bacterium]